jgi:hypothetical protein
MRVEDPTVVDNNELLTKPLVLYARGIKVPKYSEDPSKVTFDGYVK